MSNRVTLGGFVTPSASFTRPANTTAYADGDLVANSATAGSVVAMSWKVAREAGGIVKIHRARLYKSNDAPTSATFRLHLWSADPCATAPSNGDNGAIQVASDEGSYLGSIALDATTVDIHTGGNVAAGKPIVGDFIMAKCAADEVLVWGLLEAKGGFTPGNAEVFTVVLEVEQD